MAGIGEINLKVVVIDGHYYAMQSINGYLAWDRRTRVTYMTTKLEQFWNYLRETPIAELPNVVILDADHLGDAEQVHEILSQVQEIAADAIIICLGQNLPLANGYCHQTQMLGLAQFDLLLIPSSW